MLTILTPMRFPTLQAGMISTVPDSFESPAASGRICVCLKGTSHPCANIVLNAEMSLGKSSVARTRDASKTCIVMNLDPNGR